MKRKEKIDFSDIPELTAEDFKRARRATPEEVERGRRAIENTLGISRPPRVGRPTKYSSGKLTGVYIRLHPKVIEWAKREAKRRHVGYHTFLSEWLLHGAQAA